MTSKHNTSPFSWRVATMLFGFSIISLGTFSWSNAASPTSNETLKMDSVNAGREVFLTVGGVGCAACHGRFAEGDLGIGPYNRGSGEVAIRTALKSVQSMRFLQEQLTDEQIRQVADYYRWLGELQLVKVLAKQGQFYPAIVNVYPGTRIQLAVKNGSFEPHTFKSRGLSIDNFRIEGGEYGDTVWRAPDKEGSFELTCSDCSGDGRVIIQVSRSAPKYAGPRKPSKP